MRCTIRRAVFVAQKRNGRTLFFNYCLRIDSDPDRGRFNRRRRRTQLITDIQTHRRAEASRTRTQATAQPFRLPGLAFAHRTELFSGEIKQSATHVLFANGIVSFVCTCACVRIPSPISIRAGCVPESEANLRPNRENVRFIACAFEAPVLCVC